MKNLIFLDDERYIEDVTWVDYPNYKNIYIVRNYDDFMLIVSTVTDIQEYEFSFDHDIQDFVDNAERTGYTCAKSLCDYLLDTNKLYDFVYYAHSQNPIGKQNIISYIENFKRHFL